MPLRTDKQRVAAKRPACPDPQAPLCPLLHGNSASPNLALLVGPRPPPFCVALAETAAFHIETRAYPPHLTGDSFPSGVRSFCV